MTIKDQIKQFLIKAVTACQAEGLLPAEGKIDPEIERPNQSQHGDFATNLAMKLAKSAKRAPRQIAEVVAAQLKQEPALDKVEIAGPGFINLFFNKNYWLQALDHLLLAGRDYGHADWGAGRKLLLEFVSANPVGPLNVVSARAAAVGDALANILMTQGMEVSKEYYINDAGKQASLLGKSCYVRWRQSLGEAIEMPAEGYQGDYVKLLAAAIARQAADELSDLTPEEAITLFWKNGVKQMVASHQEDLQQLGVTFDHWFSELTLHCHERIEAAVAQLQDRGFVYEQDDAWWFQSTRFGDDKDRVLKKANGDWAYIAADIAYHQDKYQRGYTELLDLWGPDHHGYIPRMKAAMQALGHDPETFQVHIVQQVNLMEAGEQVAMSKRAGKFITMQELIRDVGKDVARFFFLMRSTDAHLDFDLTLARQHSDENPVFYVQYAYARICSVIKKAEAEGLPLPDEHATIMGNLPGAADEIGLIKTLTIYPEILEGCARNLEPHMLAFYLRELATSFHRFYTQCRVIDHDHSAVSQARLVLCRAAQLVLVNGLTLLGLDAPEKM